MIDEQDPNKHIREYLSYYLNLATSPGYAVMIRGPWGIGKTFLVRKILANLFPDKKGYIYVSLYGVASPNDIDNAILAAMYPILGTKTARVTGRLINAATKYLNVDGVIELKDVIDQSTTAAYVFDDIERSSMDADTIFGYINQLVEHSGSRVILIANESELEKTESYRTKREKLVGQTLEAKSAVRDAFDAFLTEITESEVREHLRHSKDQIVDLYEQGEVNNLRVLRQTLFDFERFFMAAEPHRRQHARAMLNIVRLLFALSFELKLGRIQAADLWGRRERWIAAAMAKDSESKVKASFDRYTGIDLSDTTLSDELLVELLIRGVVDKDLIRRDFDTSSWFMEPSDEPSWRTIWHWFEREDDLLNNAISAIQVEIEKFHYLEPGEILHVFGIMLMLSGAEVIQIARENIVQMAKLYIESLREKGQLRPLEHYSSFEMLQRGAWGGLGFMEAESPDFREIHAFLGEQRSQARIDRLPVLAERLMKELVVDPDLFCRRLEGGGSHQSDLIDGPVLKEIDPKVFLAAVLRQPATVQCQIFQCLRSRHGRAGNARDLEAERPWVQSLHDAMLSLAEASEPMRRYKLQNFANWIGQNARGPAEV